MNPSIIVGIAGLILGIAYTVQSLQLPKASIGNPWAPIYFPLSLGIFMTVLSVALLIINIPTRKVFKKPDIPVPWLLIIGTLIIGVGYAILFDRIGFIPSTIIFVVALLFLVGGTKGWLLNIVLAIALTLGIWYSFEKILYISLP